MNEVGCQRAIRKLCQDNSAVLTHGHYQRGSYRTIQEITLSVLTPPRLYYHFKIQVEDVEEYSFGGGPGNQAKPPRRAIYKCTIHAVDAALPSGSAGEEQYEEAHTDFRNMCNGVAAMVAGSYWRGGGTYCSYFEGLPLCIQDPESNSKFSLVRGNRNDRDVRVQNLDLQWPDTTNDVWTPMLYSRIQFNLEEVMA